MSMDTARTLELVRVKLDQRIGTELGGYRILEQVGRGGTSVVYRAEHVRLGRQAALKLLSPGIERLHYFVKHGDTAWGHVMRRRVHRVFSTPCEIVFGRYSRFHEPDCNIYDTFCQVPHGTLAFGAGSRSACPSCSGCRT